MSDLDLRHISNSIRTPAYIFSRKEFYDRIRHIKESFGSEIDLCYSIKANPFLLAILPDDISRIEVCSPGELEICIEMEIDPEKIIYSGLNKGLSDISRAVSYGITDITAESRNHLQFIQKCVHDSNRPVNVLLRVSDRSQFGIDKDELISLIQEYRQDPLITIAGLHYFTGTQKTSPRQIESEIAFLSDYIQRIQIETGLTIERLEYGPGLGVEYFAGKKNLGDPHTATRLEMDLLDGISGSLRSLSSKVRLTVEMGRFFAASCGMYFTKVVDTKRNDDINYAVVDGGSHQVHYYGHMQGMQLPFITCLTDHPGRDVSDPKWTICGSLCTTADVLARNAELGSIEIGDTLVFHKTGAYSIYESMTLFLSRDMARIYILNDHDDGNEIKLCRDTISTHTFNYAK